MFLGDQPLNHSAAPSTKKKLGEKLRLWAVDVERGARWFLEWIVLHWHCEKKVLEGRMAFFGSLDSPFFLFFEKKTRTKSRKRKEAGSLASTVPEFFSGCVCVFLLLSSRSGARFFLLLLLSSPAWHAVSDSVRVYCVRVNGGRVEGYVCVCERENHRLQVSFRFVLCILLLFLRSNSCV